MFWLGAVGIPYGALLVAYVYARRAGYPHGIRERFLDLGIDACILGIGVSGALFSTPDIADKIGIDRIALVVVILLLDFLITGISLNLRNSGHSHPGDVRAWKPALSIFLGMFMLGINTGIILVFRGHL